MLLVNFDTHIDTLMYSFYRYGQFINLVSVIYNKIIIALLLLAPVAVNEVNIRDESFHESDSRR